MSDMLEKAKEKELKVPNLPWNKNVTLFINVTYANRSNTTNQTFLENISVGFEDFQNNINGGILLNLLVKICNVLILGLTFYPILLCVELKIKSLTNYFFSSVYIWCMLVYYVYNDFVCDRNEIGAFDYLKCLIQEKLGQNPIYREFLNVTKNFTQKNNFSTNVKNMTWPTNEKRKEPSVNLEGL